MNQPDDLGALVASWPRPGNAALSVTTERATLGRAGDIDRVSPVASISKVIATLTALVAIEEGTITLEETAGPDGSTVRHLLAHASGLAFDGPQSIATVGTRRVYSNSGIEQLADHLATVSGIPFAEYQREAVLAPLGMTSTELVGSPAHGVQSSVADLVVLARELLAPSVVHVDTMAEATTPQFPSLRGVLPGFGSFDPNPWGLGLEIRGTKDPHWTAPGNSPRTFGHFGGSGTYLWVDPAIGLATVAISGTDYGPWANEAWPRANQAILDRYA